MVVVLSCSVCVQQPSKYKYKWSKCTGSTVYVYNMQFNKCLCGSGKILILTPHYHLLLLPIFQWKKIFHKKRWNLLLNSNELNFAFATFSWFCRHMIMKNQCRIIQCLKVIWDSVYRVNHYNNKSQYVSYFISVLLRAGFDLTSE